MTKRVLFKRFKGLPPRLVVSPDTEQVETEHVQKMRLKPQRYQHRPNRPMVFLLYSIAFWYDGELLRFAHVGKRIF